MRILAAMPRTDVLGWAQLALAVLEAAGAWFLRRVHLNLREQQRHFDSRIDVLERRQRKAARRLARRQRKAQRAVEQVARDAYRNAARALGIAEAARPGGRRWFDPPAPEDRRGPGG